jgi:hypothetical protein
MLHISGMKTGYGMHPAIHLSRRINRYPPPRHALRAQSAHRHRPPCRDRDVPRRARARPVRRLAVDWRRESRVRFVLSPSPAPHPPSVLTSLSVSCANTDTSPSPLQIPPPA